MDLASRNEAKLARFENKMSLRMMHDSLVHAKRYLETSLFDIWTHEPNLKSLFSES
jgi:hypothetical protein